MLHVVRLLLSRSKKGDHGTSFESDREGGVESLWNSFFQELGDGQRPAHSAPIVVAAVYLGIYIYCIAIIKSNLFRHRISQNDSGVFTIIFMQI